MSHGFKTNHFDFWLRNNCFFHLFLTKTRPTLMRSLIGCHLQIDNCIIIWNVDILRRWNAVTQTFECLYDWTLNYVIIMFKSFWENERTNKIKMTKRLGIGFSSVQSNEPGHLKLFNWKVFRIEHIKYNVYSTNCNYPSESF